VIRADDEPGILARVVQVEDALVRIVPTARCTERAENLSLDRRDVRRLKTDNRSQFVQRCRIAWPGLHFRIGKLQRPLRLDQRKRASCWQSMTRRL
jgi:hypothetical protein